MTTLYEVFEREEREMASGIKCTVKVTAPRFSTAEPSIPTIEVHDDDRSLSAHRRVMAAAHVLAAWLWSTNAAGRPIAVDATGQSVARITVETLTENGAAEREEVLRLMREAIDRLRAESGPATGTVYRPDGQAVRVTVPRRG